MKTKASKHNKMARHASMDLTGFDLPADGSCTGEQEEEEAEHKYPTEDTPNLADEASVTDPQPQLNLAAIRRTLDNDPSPRGSIVDIVGTNGNNSSRSIGAAADPTDIVSNTTTGVSRRRRQSNGSLVGRFSLTRGADKTGGSGDDKLKRLASATSGFTAASSSIGSSHASVESNLWTKLLSNTNASLWNNGGFEDDDDEKEDAVDGALPGCNQAIKTWCRGNAYEAKHVSSYRRYRIDVDVIVTSTEDDGCYVHVILQHCPYYII